MVSDVPPARLSLAARDPRLSRFDGNVLTVLHEVLTSDTFRPLKVVVVVRRVFEGHVDEKWHEVNVARAIRKLRSLGYIDVDANEWHHRTYRLGTPVPVTDAGRGPSAKVAPDATKSAA